MEWISVLESRWLMMEYGYDGRDVIGVKYMAGFGICDEKQR